MLNKYLHFISIRERGEVVALGKERPGKPPASDNLLRSVSLSDGPAYDLLSEGCWGEQYILKCALENTSPQIKGNCHRDRSWALYHTRRK